MSANDHFGRFPVLTLVAGLAVAASCRNDWRTDMWYQPSLRAEDAPRVAPEHSVALGAPTPLADRDEASDVLKNPVQPEAASVENGGTLFSERCACCHGAQGHGGGPVSKVFPPAPDLAYQTVRARSDGYIFGTITFGGRAMPSLGEGLTATDRWDLVNFVRNIQASSPAVAPPSPSPGGTP